MTKRAITEAFEQPARRRGDEAARGRRALALRGRLARGHERHARGVDPAARRVRRRRLARPRPDADARPRRPPRGGDPRVQARAVLAGRGAASRPTRRAPLRRPLHRRQAPARRRTRPPRSSTAVEGKPGDDHQAREEGGDASSPSSSTTSPRSSATPTRCTASRRAARSSAAQRLYEEHKALTYPRTNSRYLTGDMVAEIKPTAELVGPQPAVREGRRVRDSGSTSCRSSAWSTTRRSRTTTRSSRRAPSTTCRQHGRRTS